jgi:hypothetical protein
MNSEIFLILFHSGESMHRREMCQGIRNPLLRLMQPKSISALERQKLSENPVKNT